MVLAWNKVNPQLLSVLMWESSNAGVMRVGCVGMGRRMGGCSTGKGVRLNRDTDDSAFSTVMFCVEAREIMENQRSSSARWLCFVVEHAPSERKLINWFSPTRSSRWIPLVNKINSENKIIVGVGWETLDLLDLTWRSFTIHCNFSQMIILLVDVLWWTSCFLDSTIPLEWVECAHWEWIRLVFFQAGNNVRFAVVISIPTTSW